ncbi:MAG: Asp-tRNA(Asn)/Glu-tRNA(Gln) amidotransferase subunit GatC [Limisphaerales bacterium]
MSAPDFDIKYVAHLARLKLSPEEEQRLGAQLGNIPATSRSSRKWT